MGAMLAALLMLLVRACSAQHVWYRFHKHHGGVKSFSSYLRWTQAERGDVYLATQFWTGCGNGYFGGQLHKDGSHMVLFSMWDYDGATPSAQGVSPWCTRFGNEGAGAHCGLDYVFEFGTEYRFELTRAKNASGVIWSTTVSKIDPIGTETSTFLGSIFVESRLVPKDCIRLEPTACSFQEYYSGGNFYTAGAWRGPFLDRVNSAYDAHGDCGMDGSAHINVSSVVPNGPRGRPNVFFQQGGNTEHGCEHSMWHHHGVPWNEPTLEKQTVRVRPTATRPTGTGEGSRAPKAAAPRARPAVSSLAPSTTVKPSTSLAAVVLAPEALVPGQMAQAGSSGLAAGPLVRSDGLGFQAPQQQMPPTQAGGLGFQAPQAPAERVSACSFWHFVLAVALGGGSGIRATLPAFLLGLFHYAAPEEFPLSPQGQWLEQPGLCALLGLLVLVEVLADMIPALDHTLHVVLAPLHPVMGALVAIAPNYCGGWVARVPMSLAAAGLALTVHSGKAGIRTLSSGATCGVLNPCLSGCESFTAAALIVLAVMQPVVALAAVVFFIFLGYRGLKAAGFLGGDSSQEGMQQALHPQRGPDALEGRRQAALEDRRQAALEDRRHLALEDGTAVE